MKVLKFNQYDFLLTEGFAENFSQMTSQWGASPMGPGYGFATDPGLSIYGQQDSPYVDAYFRTPYMIQKVVDIMKNVYKEADYHQQKFDHFLEDIDNFTDLKILRLNPNASLGLDLFLSFQFNEEEFFGVYKNFNDLQKPTLRCELFGNQKYPYLDREYALKLDNYLYKLLTNWFRPGKGYYQVLRDEIATKNEMGEQIMLKKGQKVKVLGTNIGKDRHPYIALDYNTEPLYIVHNNYYFFHYWFEKLPEMKF